jgi:putative acetyltransferase
MTTLPTDWQLRPIEPADDPAMASVIRTVMPQFGASGEGFAITDPEVDHMSAAYGQPRHAYYVLTHQGRVVGGAGIGQLVGAEPSVCELRKMYFLPEARGRGFGEKLLRRCIAFAREAGYQTIYIETLTGMDAAMRLYERLGFQRRPNAMGATGHFGCNRFYTLDLTTPA